MPTYKESLRNHIQPLLAGGATQREIAFSLGIKNANYLSMILSDRNPKDVLSLKRLPRFSEVCDLSATDALRLVFELVDTKQKGSVEIDKETLQWIMRCTVRAMDERRQMKAMEASHVHH